MNIKIELIFQRVLFGLMLMAMTIVIGLMLFSLIPYITNIKALLFIIGVPTIAYIIGTLTEKWWKPEEEK